MRDQKLWIKYYVWANTTIERLVEPYALVTKAGTWYLVSARQGRLRVQGLDSILEVRQAEETFERAAGFDLEAFWKAWCAEQEQSHSGYKVSLRVAPDFIPALGSYLGTTIIEQLAKAGPTDADQWIELDLFFESLDAARRRILGFGRGVEVLAPRALRESVLDFAQQICGLYQG